jgi:hypothetical protein
MNILFGSAKDWMDLNLIWIWLNFNFEMNSMSSPCTMAEAHLFVSPSPLIPLLVSHTTSRAHRSHAAASCQSPPPPSHEHTRHQTTLPLLPFPRARAGPWSPPHFSPSLPRLQVVEHFLGANPSSPQEIFQPKPPLPSPTSLAASCPPTLSETAVTCGNWSRRRHPCVTMSSICAWPPSNFAAVLSTPSLPSSFRSCYSRRRPPCQVGSLLPPRARAGRPGTHSPPAISVDLIDRNHFQLWKSIENCKYVHKLQSKFCINPIRQIHSLTLTTFHFVHYCIVENSEK